MNATTTEMTTAMQHAIAKAALPTPPLNKRIWTYLKDHPRQSIGALASVLKVKDEIVRLSVRDMQLRGMVEVVKEPRRVQGGPLGTNVRDILLFSAAANMREYELLPKVRSTTRRAKTDKPEPRLLSLVAPKDLQQAESHAAGQHRFDAESMTLRDALAVQRKLHELYQQLHAVFGKE